VCELVASIDIFGAALTVNKADVEGEGKFVADIFLMVKDTREDGEEIAVNVCLSEGREVIDGSSKLDAE